MASVQVDASPLEDVITETEATSKEETQTAAPATPLEKVEVVDVEDEEEDLEDLTAPSYEEKVGDSDEEYSSFVEREDAAATFRSAGEPAAFDDFNDDDPEDEDDV